MINNEGQTWKERARRLLFMTANDKSNKDYTSLSLDHIADYGGLEPEELNHCIQLAVSKGVDINVRGIDKKIFYTR